MPSEEKATDNRIESLEMDVLQSQLMEEKARHDDYATRLYNTLCNQRFEHKESSQRWSGSFRYNGDIVGRLRQRMVGYVDYLEFYPPFYPDSLDEEVVKDLADLGWEPCEWEDRYFGKNAGDYEYSED